MDVVLNDVRARQVGEPALIESLKILVTLAARSDTGGARVATKVVLSAYNGHAYPLDIAELGSLDAAHFTHAMNVIKLRYIGHEPHEFFLDGNALFNRIAAVWGIRPVSFDSE